MNLLEKQVFYWAHMLDEAFCKETDWSSVSKDYIGKRDKQDEWYTSPENAEKIIEPFKEYLRGKKIYCNCDDPEWSGVYKFLYSKFKQYGLAQLVATGYGAKYKAVVTPETYDDPNKILQENPGNGDMNSKDSIEEAKQSDIIISNPPFSRPDKADDNLFRNWIKIAFNYNCNLIGIGMTRAVKEKFISEKMLQDKLFVYYCPRYKCGRSGKNIENTDGKKKETVQVSIYSTFDEDLNYGPALKFNVHSYLEHLPTTIWDGEQIPITVNDLQMNDTFGKSVKEDAFSRSIIPPPTRQNVGKLIALPFSVIDLDWKNYFTLVGFISNPTVTLSDGEIKKMSSAIVLKYNKAVAPDQEILNSAKDLNDSNYDALMQKMKKDVDTLFANNDVKRLKEICLNYRSNCQYWKDRTGLKQKFYKEIYDYAIKIYKLMTGYLSSASDFINAIYWIYDTTKLSIDKKLKYISKLFSSLRVKKFYKNHKDKNVFGAGSNISMEEIENVVNLVYLVHDCIQFNQKYIKFNKLVSKAKKSTNKSDSNDVLRESKLLQDFYEKNIKPRLEKPYINNNFKKEMQYKLQRISDYTNKINTELPYKTIEGYIDEFIKITGYSPDQFNVDKLTELNYSQVEAIKTGLDKLRPNVGVYRIYLERHSDAYQADIYEKLMQKTLDMQATITNAKKICTTWLKAHR